MSPPDWPTADDILALRHRSVRDDRGQFYVEGFRFVIRALESGADVRALVVASNMIKGSKARDLVRRQRRRGMPILELTKREFCDLSLAESPQGIGAVVRQRILSPRRLSGVWVGLQEVRAPGNLGTILRTCEASGAKGILLLGSECDPFDPATVRASMGSLFGVSIVRGALRPLELLRGCQVIGASGGATRDYRAIRYRRPLVVMMGCERGGLSDEQNALCDRAVRIPMRGRLDSLNLAVATSVLLYEVFNQENPPRRRAPSSAARGRSRPHR